MIAGEMSTLPAPPPPPSPAPPPARAPVWQTLTQPLVVLVVVIAATVLAVEHDISQSAVTALLGAVLGHAGTITAVNSQNGTGGS